MTATVQRLFDASEAEFESAVAVTGKRPRLSGDEDVEALRAKIARLLLGEVPGAQLHRHSDGATELASRLVEPDSRRHGIARHMVDALLADERAPVYALIDRRFVDHFARGASLRSIPVSCHVPYLASTGLAGW